MEEVSLRVIYGTFWTQPDSGSCTLLVRQLAGLRSLLGAAIVLPTGLSINDSMRQFHARACCSRGEGGS